MKKPASRTKETPEQQKQRQEYDKAQKHASRKNETPQKKKQRLEIVRTQISEKRLSKKFKCETIDAVNNFKLECKKQPVYICTSCHRLLWEKSVQKFTN